MGKALREIAASSFIGLCIGIAITGITFIAFTYFVLIPIGPRISFGMLEPRSIA